MRRITERLNILACPKCSGELSINDEEIACRECRNHYPIENGIPLLYWPNEWDDSKEDVTEIVKTFYEQTPFPNYEEFENVGDLIRKADRGGFARLLNEQIPFNIRVLEVGCGTGQLSNYLGVAQRELYGADLCLNSLKLAEEFRKNNNLERVRFYQMNLFRPIFRPETFPLVICSGVLHHTSDPFLGFKSISRLVKKRGFILLGLYNKYGRAITDSRRIVFRLSGGRFRFLDPRLRGQSAGEVKKSTWYADQYEHPHESKHTISEVLDWFDNTGFEFISGIPDPRAFQSFRMHESMFRPHPQGNSIDHLITQFSLMLKGSREGGFFVMLGRKRADD